MKKNLIVGSALALTLNIASPVWAATSTPIFTDVPTNHWSYEALTYLAKAGIIDGYEDGKFVTDKTMSRGEMAQIVYKAMINENKANIAQKALIDKLANEYALEMNKIENLDTRLTKVEKNQSTIKFSGALLVQEKIKGMKNAPTSIGSHTESSWFRMNGTAKVDDNTTIGMRIVNVAPTQDNFRAANSILGGTQGNSSSNTYGAQIDRFFATTKIGAVKATLGRQALDLDNEDMIVDSAFFSFDGAKLAWESNGVNFDVKHGRFARGVRGYAFDNKAGGAAGTYAADFSNVDVQAISASAKSGKLNWAVGAATFRNWKNDKKLLNYTYGNLGWKFNNKLSISGEYGKNNEATSDGAFGMAKVVYGAQSLKDKGDQNFTTQYFVLQKNSIYTAYTAIDTVDEGNSNANKTLDFAYRYAFSKNMTGKLQYATIKDKTASTNDYDFWKLQFIYKF
ncbi:S-layer homology domain-containing protein [Pelosinus sp. sgz500959]|uniref:S-layer homology domain-containing protein n=1 Tax=Pelosinus sp. sgz500959 TaxID=3242472 RepID=UPI0036713A56